MADQPKSEERENQKERHLVILVHGINTFADWMPAMADTLESAGFLVSPTSFGDMRVSRFLLPIGRPRQQAIQRVLTNIRTAKELHKPDRISVITHSFGTYVVARILQREPWPWHRIIFCGSVLPEKFPLDEVRDRFTAPLLNEVGTRDIWPAMAAWVTWGYGSVGSYGFNHPTVRTRWHEGFRHSDFLTSDFCNKYWVPFLRDGTIIRGSDKPSRLPWTIRAITKIPLRWIVLFLFLALLGLGVWYILYGRAITIDLQAFDGPPKFSVSIHYNTTMQSVLNSVYNKIIERDKTVGTRKYQKDWILVDAKEHPVTNIGTEYAKCLEPISKLFNELDRL